MGTRYTYLPPPPRNQHTGECNECHGAGVTGDRYEIQANEAVMILVDVFCPECNGCGNGNHNGCAPKMHADFNPDEDGYEDELTELEYELDENRCPQCQGRTWNPLQAFAGDEDDPELMILRAPCGGCAESLMIDIPPDPGAHVFMAPKS